MAWSGRDRLDRLPDDWRNLRQRILERDGWSCRALQDSSTVCGEFATDVDHIERGDNHSELNLQAICRTHHRKKTAREGGAAWAALRAAEKRPKEKHPGLID